MNRRSFLKFLAAIPGLAWFGSREQSDVETVESVPVFIDDHLTDKNDWFLIANNQDPPVTWNQLGHFISPILHIKKKTIC